LTTFSKFNGEATIVLKVHIFVIDVFI